MTEEQTNRLAFWAVIALTVIAVAAIFAAIAVSYVSHERGAVAAVVTATVGGIVAIVLREGGK